LATPAATVPTPDSDTSFTDTSFVRVFGKPESHIGRRMAVSLVLDEDIEHAKERATQIVESMADV
jgi:phosphoribosylglycinamide formyltransferase 2